MNSCSEQALSPFSQLLLPYFFYITLVSKRKNTKCVPEKSNTGLRKLRKQAMTEFLIGDAFVALISIMTAVILGRHADKQLKEYKKRADQK